MTSGHVLYVDYKYGVIVKNTSETNEALQCYKWMDWMDGMGMEISG